MSSLSEKREQYKIVRPVLEPEIKYNCRVKYFPDNQIRIACFSKPIFNPLKAEVKKEEKPFESLREYDPITGTMSYKFVEGKTILAPFSNEYIPIMPYRREKSDEVRPDNIKRAIDKAFEIGLANDFQYFITLTLDAKKIDRYDTEIIYKKLRNWLSNRVKRNDMDYIIFPEYHKQREGEEERAIHFHGLIRATGLKLTDSGKRTKKEQVIYNLDGWKFGYSTVIELNGQPGIIKYVTKYITKGNAKIFGKFYFSGGHHLERVVPTDFLNVDYSSFEGQEYEIPAAGMCVKYRSYNLDFDPDAEEEDDALE